MERKVRRKPTVLGLQSEVTDSEHFLSAASRPAVIDSSGTGCDGSRDRSSDHQEATRSIKGSDSVDSSTTFILVRPQGFGSMASIASRWANGHCQRSFVAHRKVEVELPALLHQLLPSLSPFSPA